MTPLFLLAPSPVHLLVLWMNERCLGLPQSTHPTQLTLLEHCLQLTPPLTGQEKSVSRGIVPGSNECGSLSRCGLE